MSDSGFLDRISDKVRRKYQRAKGIHHYFLEKSRIKKLRSLQNIHAGEDAVIVGMGPSLQFGDLDRISSTVSFACNKIYLAFEKTHWRPNYYTICDILIAQNNRDIILRTDFGNALPIHSEIVWDILRKQRRAMFYKYNGSIAEWHPCQQAIMRNDLSNGILGHGYSVVIDQIQLAYAMGFQKVFIIGVDFAFSGGVSTGQNSASGFVLKSNGEQNHFHPEYRKPGETWTVPRLKEMSHAFAFCRTAFERAGRKLYNASRSTALTEIERVSFDKVFPK